MILRLKLYQLSLKVYTYLLPMLAFYLGWYAWKACCAFLGRPVLFSLHGHLNQILFGTLVWAVVSEHYRVTSFDELFRERTGARAAWSACLATSFVLLALLYFSRNDIYPRGLLIWDVIALLTLTVMLHAIFRVIFRSSASLAKPTRLLVVGADQFARDAAQRLQRITFAPCQISGFVRLPGQDVGVEGHRIYELEQLILLHANHGIDERQIAYSPRERPDGVQINGKRQQTFRGIGFELAAPHRRPLCFLSPELPLGQDRTLEPTYPFDGQASRIGDLKKNVLVKKYNDQVDYNMQQSVLMSNEGLVNYRYKYRRPIQNLLVIDLLLFDPNNPRSLTYQVVRLKSYLQNLPKNNGSKTLAEYERLILEADTLLKLANKTELDMSDDEGYPNLEIFLTRLFNILSVIPGVISKAFFKHELTPKTIIIR